jgi:two-component system, sensor histidine kinase and response regulator
MIQIPANPELDQLKRRRADELFHEHQQQIYRRTDRMFAVLMVIQWVASIAAALWISPRTWSGSSSQLHIHVWAAIFLGGTITAAPVVLARWYSGQVLTRHVIAVAQMLTSALLIHLTGGRIETHFHVFGSLAFLAFYRDWRVLITATLVVAVDHFLRGVFWPESVYGVHWVTGMLWTPLWRSLEHAGWVIFEDIILVRWCIQGIREMREVAAQTAELETTNEHVEQLVIERTAELGASEERSRAIINLSSDAFIAMNADGQIVEWNRQAETTFGWSREEALKRKLADTIVPERYSEGHRAGLAQFLESGKGDILNKRIEITAVDCEGKEFPVELTISPIRFEREWLFSAFVRDITSRKQADAELRQAKDAAEAANQAKSEFLANMSHEIRTPLNGIVGMTELALDTPLTPGQREYLSTVKSCTDSLLTVINDILDFSKIEAGKLNMDRVGFDLHDLLGETCKTMGFRAHQKNLELACRVASEVPKYLMGDPGRLRQVIVNLIGNAIKFTKEGEVVLGAQVSSKTDKDVRVHFTVLDTGIGIPPHKLSGIFKAFEQADNSTTRLYGGTGLGLAIASKIINLMGGEIWVESLVGHGSTFHFTARFELDSAAAGKPAASDPVSLTGMRVLVVDDNTTNRRILEEILHNWRMRPVLAANADQALVALEGASTAGEPFPLVLLDAQMPEVDGFMLVRKIKANPKIAGSTLMMLSSAAQLSDAQRCRQLGVSAYLTKPIKQSELLDTIVLLLCPGNDLSEQMQKIKAELRPAAKEVAERWQILLAEDNPVNQRVACGILEKHGHTVTAVENGAEALKALTMQRFDLVLMDLQMPEMDGFAATAAIREMEGETGGHLPIVAMTARAMKGDRECCLEAGMDGYISKPVNPKELLSVIGGLLTKPHSKESSTTGNYQSPENCDMNGNDSKPSLAAGAAEAGTENLPVVDFEELLERVENDTTLLDEMIGLYLDSSPRLLTEIESGVQRQDAPTVQRAAHALKGALQNLSATPCAEMALALEQMGRAGQLKSADRTLLELKEELDRLQAELRSWSKETIGQV